MNYRLQSACEYLFSLSDYNLTPDEVNTVLRTIELISNGKLSQAEHSLRNLINMVNNCDYVDDVLHYTYTVLKTEQ